jgi:hypothetical protein
MTVIPVMTGRSKGAVDNGLVIHNRLWTRLDNRDQEN